MDQPRCPGQDMRNWKPDDIFFMACPRCGAEIEFWKDEPIRVCRGCQQEVRNPRMDLGCAQWCASAEACLAALTGQKPEDRFCRSLLGELKRLAGAEHVALTNHALQVLDYAEQILATEGGDALVVKAAAILYHIPIPPIDNVEAAETSQVRVIAKRLNIPTSAIDPICMLVEHIRNDSPTTTWEFKVLWDAFRLANIMEAGRFEGDEMRQSIREMRFYTSKGCKLAGRALRVSAKRDESEG